MRRHAKASSVGSTSATGKAWALGSLAALAVFACLLIGASSASAYLTPTGEFGSGGAGDGQFDGAVGVATNDTTGDVYVVDAGNNRVQRFDADGKYLSQFGEAGSGPGQFSEAESIAIDQSDGSLYVSDRGSNRIEKFDASGAFLSAFGTSGEGQLAAPKGLAVDPTNGDILVADAGNNRIARFDGAGGYLAQYGEPGQFSDPRRVAVDASGDFYVLELFGQVRKFSPTGELLNSVAANFALDFGLNQGNGHLFVIELTADTEKFLIVEYDAAGVKIESYEPFPFPENFDNGLAVNSEAGLVYLTDAKRVAIWEEPPPVFLQMASPTYTEAKLSAKVSPEGLQTTYRFEYGLTSAYGKSTPAKTLSAGNPPVAVVATILGLAEGTTYHFRAVSTNGNGENQGADQTFTTLAHPAAANCPNGDIRAAQGATQLGDCRAFEKVSPDYKNSADALWAGLRRSSVSGDSVTFQARSAFAGAQGGARVNQFMSRRGPGGWQTESLTPYLIAVPNSYVGAMGFEDFDAELTRGVFFSANSPLSKVETNPHLEIQLYLRHADGGYSEVSPPSEETPLLDIPYFYQHLQYVGSSDDMSRVFFESDQQLIDEAPAAGTKELYEWSSGQLRIVGVLPNGEVAPQGASSPYSRPADSPPNNSKEGAISGDGSQVVFRSAGQLYLREGGQTTQITLSQQTGSLGEPAAQGGSFMGTASPDGKRFSRIYFVSGDALTDDAREGSGGEGDLYEYDPTSGQLRDLTVTTTGSNPSGARVEPRWFRVSPDGSNLYFPARGALAPGGDENGYNIYAMHAGEVDFISADFTAGSEPEVNLTGAPVAVSSDGSRALLFTDLRLTVVDNNKHTQAYIYDAATGSTKCASCPPGRPVTTDAAPSGTDIGIFVPGAAHVNRNLTDDGKRVFFETVEALDPRDSNGQFDVYEWEDGQVHLVSSGQGTEGAHFVDASADGNDVFIATREPVLPTDTDENVDIYDARVNGGLPLPPVPGAPCEGDSCQSPPNPPNDATPASLGFKGAGNEKQRKAKVRHKNKKQKKNQKARHRRQAKKRAAAHRTTTRRHG